MARQPTVLEATACNLAAIRDTYRVGEGNLIVALAKARGDMAKQLIRWHETGKVTRRNLNGLRAAKFGRTGAAEKRMVAVFRSIGAQGIQHVNDELQRQRGMDPGEVVDAT